MGFRYATGRLGSQKKLVGVETIDTIYANSDDKCIYGQSNVSFAAALATSSVEKSTDVASYVGVSYNSGNGYYVVYRNFQRFDTSGIGETSEILEVKIAWRIYGWYAGADESIYIKKHDWSGQTREQAYDGCKAADYDDNVLLTGSNYSGNRTYTSGLLDNSWINKSGYTYYSYLTTDDIDENQPSSSNVIYFYTANWSTASQRPYLRVKYIKYA